MSRHEDRAISKAPSHSGKEDSHEEWKTKTFAWAVGQQIADALFEALNPHDYPRRENDETILTTDDPRGVVDTVLPKQTERQYETSLTTFDAAISKGWAAILPVLHDNALTVGLRARKKDGRHLVQLLDEHYAKKTKSQVATMLIDFIQTKREADSPMGEHINNWLDKQRKIDDQKGFQLETLHVVLFLLSLGPQYRMFVNLACMYGPQDFTLQNVMAKARDFSIENGDEARTSDVGLYTAREAPPRSERHNKPKCAACGADWHTYQECFDGGLKHLDTREKREHYLETKRKLRDIQKGHRGNSHRGYDNRDNSRRDNGHRDRKDTITVGRNDRRDDRRRGRSRSRSRSRDRGERRNSRAFAALQKQVKHAKQLIEDQGGDPKHFGLED